MANGGSNKKVANSLVAVSAAAVMAVYAAGYSRTSSAADKFEAAERRPAPPHSRPPAAPAAAVEPGASDISSSPAETPVQVASVDPHPQPTPTPAHRAPTSAVSAVQLPAKLPEKTIARALSAAEPKTEVATLTPGTVPAPSTPAPAAPAVILPVAPAVPAPAVPAQPSAVAPAAKWKDGTYVGWGTCRHGDIEASLVIAGGRITTATIAQCLTRYSCDVIGRLPPEVIQRQSAEVDYVSGATESADAFYYAVFDALNKAK